MFAENLQGAPAALSGAEITRLLNFLRSTAHCLYCGQIPIFYYGNGKRESSNNPGSGILKVDYVSNTRGCNNGLCNDNALRQEIGGPNIGGGRNIINTVHIGIKTPGTNTDNFPSRPSCKCYSTATMRRFVTLFFSFLILTLFASPPTGSQMLRKEKTHSFLNY